MREQINHMLFVSSRVISRICDSNISFFIHSGVAEDHRRQSGLSAGGVKGYMVSSLRSTEEEMSRPLFINSAKEIVFFTRVRLFVGLSAILHKNNKRDFHEMKMEGGSQP